MWTWEFETYSRIDLGEQERFRVLMAPDESKLMVDSVKVELNEITYQGVVKHMLGRRETRTHVSESMLYTEEIPEEIDREVCAQLMRIVDTTMAINAQQSQD